MGVQGAQTAIIKSLSTWEGVQACPHRFGGIEFRIGNREIGHIHGDSLVDIPFPSRLHDEIVQTGEAQPHHILPNSGWVSFYLVMPEDVERAILLLRRSYDLAVKQNEKRNLARFG